MTLQLNNPVGHPISQFPVTLGAKLGLQWVGCNKKCTQFKHEPTITVAPPDETCPEQVRSR